LGLLVTVNSDDPAYFGGYMVDNFVAVAEALKLSKAELTQLVVNGFEASFMDPVDKAKWIEKVQTYSDAWQG
jgi:adenosine deaminase